MSELFNVIYYRYKSIYCRDEYENVFFDSLKGAKEFIFEIVQEEERDINDKDFYEWKVLLKKISLNNKEKNYDYKLIYDLNGNLIYDSRIFYKNQRKYIKKSFKIGDLVKVLPFPWCINSPIELSKCGVVAGYIENNYIIYLIDDCKILHLHINENALEKNNCNSKLLYKLSNIIKENNGKISEEYIRLKLDIEI